ncbi:hypothetical protein ACJJTC_005143 [Scirpophaga incertulas]
MKYALLLVALSAVLVSDASVLKAPVTRANLNVGYIGPGDRLLYRNYVYQPARPNTVQSQDVIWRGNVSNRLTAITAYEVGATQYASAFIINGGVNRNNVTIRFQSARGYGYYYQYELWGR